MDTVDAVARALANAIWGGSPLIEDAFELLSDGEQDTYRSWARAAIDALGLTEEWRATCDGAYMPLAEKSRDRAEHSLRTLLSNNATFEQNQGRIPDFARNPRLESRLVSGWVRKDNTNE